MHIKKDSKLFAYADATSFAWNIHKPGIHTGCQFMFGIFFTTVILILLALMTISGTALVGYFFSASFSALFFDTPFLEFAFSKENQILDMTYSFFAGLAFFLTGGLFFWQMKKVCDKITIA